MKEFKYTSIFASKLRCATEKEDNSFLSVASLTDLKALMPDASDDDTLLSIAANSCTVNVGNFNGDMIDTDTGLFIYKKFIHKFIDIEHDRSKIVGHLTSANLSKYSSNYSLGVGSELIKEKDVKDAAAFEPFNIAVGGYVYKVAAANVCQKILDANNPESEDFLAISLSWEIGFNAFQIVVSSDRTLANGTIIDSEEEFKKYLPYLRSEKGSGQLPDGRYVFRLLVNDPEDPIAVIGVGLTFNPAGTVAGVVTDALTSDALIETNLAKAALNEEKIPLLTEINEENNEIIQISENNSANANKTAVVVREQSNMKIFKSLKDIEALTDESAKEFSFANIANVVSAEVERIAKEYDTKIKQEQEAAASVAKSLEEAKAESTELKAEINKLNESFKALSDKQAEAQATQDFNQRMAGFDEKYELDAEVRQIVASRIKGMDKESFEAYANEFAILSKSISKEVIAKAAEAAKAKEVVASKVEAKSVGEVAVAAIEGATPTDPVIPNAVTPANQSLKEQFANAFKIGAGIEVSNRTRK